MPLENLTSSQSNPNNNETKRVKRKFVISSAHGKGSLTEGSENYGQKQTTTVFTGGESGMVEDSRVKKVEFHNNKTEDRTRETTYENSGRKVTRFEDRVEVVYNDGQINDPQKISKEIYYKGKKEIIYGDGRTETILKKETLEPQGSPLINNITQAISSHETNYDSSLTLKNYGESIPAETEEVTLELNNLTLRINKAKQIQEQIDLLQSQITAEEIPLISSSEKESAKTKESFWKFLDKNKAEATPKVEPIVREDKQLPIKNQIEELKKEISETLSGLSIQEAIKYKNDLTQNLILNQINEQFKKNSYRFLTEGKFNDISNEYNLYKQEIATLISSIYNKDNNLLQQSPDIDVKAIQEKVLKDILINFETPYGLNAFLAVCAANNYETNPASDQFIKDRFYPFVAEFLRNNAYGVKSEFISDPRFLKFFTHLSSKSKFENINLGTPSYSASEIWRTLSRITAGGGDLRKEEVATIISLIPDNFNPNSTLDQNNYLYFYNDLNNLISNQGGIYRSKGYVARFPEQAKEIIEKILIETKQPSFKFFSEALEHADNEISQSSITNMPRVIREIQLKENTTEVSANNSNDSLIREFFQSGDVTSSEKERFFLRIRDNLNASSSDNSFNAFFSSLNYCSPDYINSYLTQSTIDIIKSKLINELKNDKESGILSNPAVFSFFSLNNPNLRADIIFSQVFNDMNLGNNEKVSKLRSFYAKYVTNLYPISEEEGLKRSKSINVMSQIYPSGVIFKNFNTDVDQLSEIYENLDNLYPNIANNPEKAKEIIERLTSKNRNISIAEFKSILEKANNELNG
jgi:hypothetical protein